MCRSIFETEYSDILFLGGAPHANNMTSELKDYDENLSMESVGRVVLFTTSNWSRQTVLVLKQRGEKGITLSSQMRSLRKA